MTGTDGDHVTRRLGKLLVISGPSGSGKTSIVRALREDPRVEFSVSATTRPPRPGEVDGRDYRFLDEKEFLARVERGEFLEWARYNDHLYGTLREPLERALDEGRVFVLEIEVQGTRQLREKKVEGIYVFIVPPDLDKLRERLRRRGSDSEAEIDRRLAIARQELRARGLYDHQVVNDDLDRAVAEVRRIAGLDRPAGSGDR